MPLDQEFMDFMQQVSVSMGFDTNSSEIMALLYVEPRELALEEIARRTGYSLASASIRMNLLESIGAVQRVRKPGSRKLYYYMQKDIAAIVRNRLISIYSYKIAPSKTFVPRLIKKYKASKADSEKIKILENYSKQIRKVEKAMREMIRALGEDK